MSDNIDDKVDKLISSLMSSLGWTKEEVLETQNLSAVNMAITMATAERSTRTGTDAWVTLDEIAFYLYIRWKQGYKYALIKKVVQAAVAPLKECEYLLQEGDKFRPTPEGAQVGLVHYSTFPRPNYSVN